MKNKKAVRRPPFAGIRRSGREHLILTDRRKTVLVTVIAQIMLNCKSRAQLVT